MKRLPFLGAVLGGLASLVLAGVWSPVSASVVSERTQHAVPQLRLSHTFLKAVSATSTGNVWAVGSNPSQTKGVAERWDGSSWTRMVLLCDCSFDAVSTLTADDVWVVANGDDSAGLEHWDGTMWTYFPSPTQQHTQLSAVSAASPDDVWAVGSTELSNGAEQTLSLHWDGAEWSTVPVAPHRSRFPQGLLAVSAVSATDALAVGWTTGHPLFYHWNGGRWQRTRDLDLTGAATGVSTPSATDGWAVGAGDRSGRDTVHWDGAHWTVVDNAAGPEGQLTSVADRAPNDVWAGGLTRQTDPYTNLIEHWDGSSWTLVPTPNPYPQHNEEVTGIAAVSADDAWAVGIGYDFNAQVKRSFVLHWDGQDWTG